MDTWIPDWNAYKLAKLELNDALDGCVQAGMTRTEIMDIVLDNLGEVRAGLFKTKEELEEALRDQAESDQLR